LDHQTRQSVLSNDYLASDALHRTVAVTEWIVFYVYTINAYRQTSSGVLYRVAHMLAIDIQPAVRSPGILFYTY
jgi:hypothetical protein